MLEVPRALYQALMTDLAASGRGVKEAGAFLLGDLEASPAGQRRLVRSYLMYEKVAPLSSSQHAYVAFTAGEMARAWEHCYSVGMQVVADVHTHPLGPAQSKSDRAHPIVSIPGHVALIVPYFAMSSTLPSDLGVQVFGGQGRWVSLFNEQAAAAIELT